MLLVVLTVGVWAVGLTFATSAVNQNISVSTKHTWLFEK